ncbi:acyl-CoA N-acyltransferase [Truncatella angustata]|uniref:Acyl-CoA N-acyltransferase n=1 Tax=Truncatella angustata TaxID=152316 RepID=A0A9P8ZWZ4_9PEZI|nr:acyl-CoA N-acyltransferase [Truncatella angustata]KAH6652593.1 acyl-CoA N-acyltransferase [Truncatella angustata]KAH8203827.1 hypothetical protein TruAng_002004 [Truncatella angustata]
MDTLPTEYPKLEALTKEQLQRLYVKNKFELTRHVSASVGAEPQRYGGGDWIVQWHKAPPGSEVHNLLEHQDVPDEHISTAINIVMHSLQNRQFSWVTGPGDQARLEHFLQQKNFTVADEAATMAIGLRPREMTRYVQPPSGVTISDVNALGVRTWVQTWAPQASQTGIGQWTRTYYSMLKSLHRNQFSLFMAERNGDPVGTGFLHCFAGVASVHAIHVLPEARGHGIGGALTSYAMQKAASLGYNVVTLTSTASSARLFTSAGFHPFGYVKLNMWHSIREAEREKQEKDKFLEAEEEGWCVV